MGSLELNIFVHLSLSISLEYDIDPLKVPTSSISDKAGDQFCLLVLFLLISPYSVFAFKTFVLIALSVYTRIDDWYLFSSYYPPYGDAFCENLFNLFTCCVDGMIAMNWQIKLLALIYSFCAHSKFKMSPAQALDI